MKGWPRRCVSGGGGRHPAEGSVKSYHLLGKQCGSDYWSWWKSSGHRDGLYNIVNALNATELHSKFYILPPKNPQFWSCHSNVKRSTFFTSKVYFLNTICRRFVQSSLWREYFICKTDSWLAAGRPRNADLPHGHSYRQDDPILWGHLFFWVLLSHSQWEREREKQAPLQEMSRMRSSIPDPGNMTRAEDRCLTDWTTQEPLLCVCC